MSITATEIRKKTVWYYVETYADFEDAENPSGTTIFRAHLIQATKPRDAEAEALADSGAHFGPRGPEKIGHFMTRRLTDEKAEKIRAQIEAGTWEGWRF